MAKVQRSTDLIEMIAERALFCVFAAVFVIGFSGILLKFRGDGWFVPLGWLLLIFGVCFLSVAIYSMFQVKKVTSIDVVCPFCEAANPLLETPVDDFACVSCNRMIPIQDGKVMEVMQVQCGFCKALNWYCEKTEILICESCDHEIPISQDDDKPIKTLPKGFALTEDDALYELVLTEGGIKTEEVISTLQHMLALNRNQVKDILDQLPSTLLTGINRRKAEMLQAQLAIHGATATIQALAL
ncbi:MAG TPA: ribosomal protein L7/L12 [Fimbriimonadaceae bacterium]|nr:ribosomal protein L7/L12 [Fimbriimonadaceae bacterium]